METPGARLKKIRLEKGISLEEVYKKTKIHLNILKSIEEDSLINFNPVYIRGFVKIYCTFLGVDPREYIADYRQPTPPGKPAAIVPAAERPAVRLRVPSLKFPSLKDLPLKAIQRAGLVILVAVVSVFLLVKVGRFVSSRLSALKKERHSAVSRPKKTQTAKTPTKAAVQTAPRSEQPAAETPKPAAPHQQGIRLAVLAKENCWTSVKVDGKVVFQGVLAKGRSDSWLAKEKIELSLGNAGAVDLEVNGRLISSLGKKGQALKNILITKEGLSTTR